MRPKPLCPHCGKLEYIDLFENKSIINWRMRSFATPSESTSGEFIPALCDACGRDEDPLPDFYGRRGPCYLCNREEVDLYEILNKGSITFVCRECL